MSYKIKKVLSLIIFCLSLVILLLAVSLFFYQQAYAGKIYRNIYFNDTNLSGMSKSEASAVIQDKYNNLLQEELTVKSSGGEVKTRVSDTGISLNIEEIVNNSYSAGRSQNFFDDIFLSAKTLIRPTVLNFSFSFKEESYNNFIQIAVHQLNSEPKDATISVDNGIIVEQPGEPGYQVNIDTLDEQIISAINDHNFTLALQKETVGPTVASADFNQARIQAENYLNKTINLKLNDKTYTPTRSEIGDWIEFQKDSNGLYQATLSDSNIKAYLNKIASGVEVKKADRKVNATDQSVIEEGRAGIFLEKNKALSSIKSQINNSTITVTLETYTEEPKEILVYSDEGAVAGRFEGKYIDVNLTTQRLCRFESTSNLGCYIISSGKASMPTPTGTFKIQNKNTRQWSGRYGLWMPYWQAFNGDYGLHELPEWPNGYKEGQDHLGIPVSHGCVRLGIGDAATVFDWTEIGTPVYIHK